MSLIDWSLAIGAGTRLAPAGPDVSAGEATDAVAALSELAAAAVEPVRRVTQLVSDPAEHRTTVVDRPAWIRSNVAGLRLILEPLEARILERRSTSVGTDLGAKASALEVGGALAWLATKVLGQYEAFSVAGQPGRLMLVAPNIVAAEREMDVPTQDFRTWVCVHEEAHRVQFGAVLWLTEHFRAEIDTFLSGVELDNAAALRRLGAVLRELIRILAGDRDASIADAVQSPAQRAVFARLTALMSLLEGHAEWVMDAVGTEVIPSVALLRTKLDKKRGNPSTTDGLLRRLLGMDAKMRQYSDGRRFVKTVVAQVGTQDFNRIWSGPDTLPTREEIVDPDSWVRRVLR